MCLGKDELMQKKKALKVDFSRNVKLYYAAIGIIILGYLFLSIGDADSFTSITLGPVILVIGYLVAVPIALLSGGSPKAKKGESQTDDSSQ